MVHACNLFSQPLKSKQMKVFQQFFRPAEKCLIGSVSGVLKNKLVGCLMKGIYDILHSAITEIYAQPIPNRYSRPSMLADVCPFILLMAELLNQLIGNLSHYFQGFIYTGWCRISSINRKAHFTGGMCLHCLFCRHFQA